jgi:ATP-dependent helicase/DNAse subunit B
MYEQLKNSKFKVESAESKCEIQLDTKVKLYGRIDRVDSYGDMVRVVDYKTGTVDSSPTKYYMGLKLQLPLYLLSASKGRRGVGTYYFPATVEYKDKKDGVFRLQGFMDGSAEVVEASDTTLEEKCKSEYFDAYLKGRKIDSAMETEQFSYFLKYSALVAEQGAREMLNGNITPSPAAEACKYCKVGGSCGFSVGVDGAQRDHSSVKCTDIARVVENKEKE